MEWYTTIFQGTECDWRLHGAVTVESKKGKNKQAGTSPHVFNTMVNTGLQCWST